MAKEKMDFEIVVKYSDKCIDKKVLSELLYDIMDENLKRLEGDTNEKEDSCA